MGSRSTKSGEIQEGKVWFERSGTILTLGITQAAISELGELESIELPSDSQALDQDDVLVTLDGSLSRLEVFTPISLTVVSVNGAAQDEPSTVSDDPLEGGWLVKVEIDDLEEFEEVVQRSE